MRFSFFVGFIALVISFACFEGVDAKRGYLNRRRVVGLEKRAAAAAGTTNTGVAPGTNPNPISQANGVVNGVGTTVTTINGLSGNLSSPQGVVGSTVTGTATSAGGVTGAVGGATVLLSGLTGSSAPAPAAG